MTPLADQRRVNWRGASAAWFLLLVVLCCASDALADSARPQLSPRNIEAPFCYLKGAVREWPIGDLDIENGTRVQLTAEQDGRAAVTGSRLDFAGLSILVTNNGRLRMECESPSSSPAFRLTIRLERDGESVEEQTISVRPAPPARPISYLADLVDDLIRIFWNSSAGEFRPIQRDAFDQYFRRLQAHGVNRLIVWQSPFPYISNRDSYATEDWKRNEAQARAIIDSQSLTEGMHGRTLKEWKWLRMLMALRLNPEFGEMFTQSAQQHGIKLSASFRPFEPALTKYYELPVFDAVGNWRSSFLPLASPIVSAHADQVCFANVRTILDAMGQPDAAEPTQIDIANVRIPPAATMISESLQIVASRFPPIDPESYVLVGQADGRHELKKYKTISAAARERRVPVSGFETTAADEATLQITNLKVPADHRFLIFSWKVAGSAATPWTTESTVSVRTVAGNRLARTNAYCVFPIDHPAGPLTRIAGISADGGYRTTFQTIENSLNNAYKESNAANGVSTQLVIDLGAVWSVEMLDFQRPAARRMAVDQMKHLLQFPAFDEVFINTRSHCQLAASTADGVDGIKPVAHYRRAKKNYFHLGIDRAFAPISLAKNP